MKKLYDNKDKLGFPFKNSSILNGPLCLGLYAYQNR